MLYVFDLGGIEQSLARQAYLQGQPLPERIKNAPELKMGLELYLQAFYDLDTDRSHGMGLTRIPWAAIQYYGEVNEFDEEQHDDLHWFIRTMDNAHLERLNEKEKK